MNPSHHTSRTRVAALVLTAASLFSACKGGTDFLKRPPDFEKRDSAGVVIVENRRVEQRFLQAWSIDTSPDLTIGVASGDTVYEFGGIRGVRQLDNGVIAVAIGEGESAYQLRFFDAEGKHIATHGRAGDGPGEFGWINFFGSAGGDTLVAVDFAHRRLNWLSVTSGFLRAEPIDENLLRRSVGANAGGLVEALVPLDDSLFAVTAFRRTADASRPLERTLSYHIVDVASGTAIELASYTEPAARLVELSTGPTFIAARLESVSPARAVDRERDRICAGIGSAGEIRCVDADKRRMIIRWPVDTVPYTADDRNAADAGLRASLGQSGRHSSADVEKLLSAYEYPSHFPPFITFLLDAGGNFWVLEHALARPGQRYSRFRIFNPEGEQIAFADAFPIGGSGQLNSTVHIGSNVILRRITGPDGSERVGVYKIRKR